MTSGSSLISFLPSLILSVPFSRPESSTLVVEQTSKAGEVRGGEAICLHSPSKCCCHFFLLLIVDLGFCKKDCPRIEGERFHFHLLIRRRLEVWISIPSFHVYSIVSLAQSTVSYEKMHHLHISSCFSTNPII